MYTFHVIIHARADHVALGREVELAGGAYRELSIGPGELAEPLPVSFDGAIDSLAPLPGMFCEPDGSFVWASPTGAPRWQVDGQLTEHADRLHTVELNGACPADQFDQLLAALGPPGTALVIQLVREGIYLDEAEFRRWATTL